MRLFVSSMGLAAVAWVLSSCATQVYLNKWAPSQVDLPRGTVLRVEPETRGPLRHELRRAFEQQIARDDYYRLGGAAPQARLRLHRVHVNMVEPARDDKRHKHSYPNRVELTADLLCNYQRVYRRDVSEYVSLDFDNRPNWEDAAEEIAAEVMRDLTSHQVRYSETVDEVETNPAVEKAALACAAGNWEGGRSLARQALAQNPNEAEAYYVLGLIERNARNYTASDAHFRKAHSLNPQGKYLSAIHDNSRLQYDEQRAHQQMQ